MEHFLGFAIPGVPYGCTYAIVAVGLVLTYQATGVFNFAYGAQAYLSAFLFTRLVQNEHLPVWLSFVLTVVVLGTGGGGGLRPPAVQQDRQHQHHGQTGHRHQPLRGHPGGAGGVLRERQPVQPAEHPVQPRHRLLPGGRDADQRDLRHDGPHHGARPGRPRAAAPVLQPRSADAWVGREPSPDRARRRQRRSGGGRGLGHLGVHGRPWPASSSPPSTRSSSSATTPP